MVSFPCSKNGARSSLSRMLNTFLHRSVFRLLWGRGHGCPNRIQIHIGHAGEQGPIVQQRLGFEAALPEATSALVLAIGHAGNGFINAAHQPGKIGQSFTPGGKQFIPRWSCNSVRSVPAMNCCINRGPVKICNQRWATSSSVQSATRAILILTRCGSDCS